MTADVVGLYPNIPHSESLDTFKKQYKTCPNKKVSAEDIGKMVDFVLQNNLFEFDSKAIGKKFAPPYACFFMDHIERNF